MECAIVLMLLALVVVVVISEHQKKKNEEEDAEFRVSSLEKKVLKIENQMEAIKGDCCNTDGRLALLCDRVQDIENRFKRLTDNLHDIVMGGKTKDDSTSQAAETIIRLNTNDDSSMTFIIKADYEGDEIEDKRAESKTRAAEEPADEKDVLEKTEHEEEDRFDDSAKIREDEKSGSIIKNESEAAKPVKKPAPGSSMPAEVKKSEPSELLQFLNVSQLQGNHKDECINQAKKINKPGQKFVFNQKQLLQYQQAGVIAAFMLFGHLFVFKQSSHGKEAVKATRPDLIKPEPLKKKIKEVTKKCITSQTKDSSPEEYSEKASRFEMELAGNWLNVAGILLIMAGAIYFLRVAWLQMQPGVPHILTGAVTGIMLIVLGDRFHRHGMKKLGQSVISGGFCILFFTVSGAFFYFHLINSLIMGILLFALTIASGFTIFHYDSKIIANVVVFISFVAPFLMKVSFDSLSVVYFYLIALNLGAAFVAYYKKWDYYVMAPFLLTYLHYFRSYHLTGGSAGANLAFLTVFYAIFLLANNLFHFKRESSGGYNLFISYFNPLLYGCVSYYVLLKAPNWKAFSIYAALGLIHLYIMNRAKKREEMNPEFSQITRTNLVLGLMFITSAISFVTYFNINDDRFFSLVTGLWFIQAFILLITSFRYGFCDRILRRFSYMTLGIIWAQLIAVVSWMPQDNAFQVFHKFSIYFISMILFYEYFVRMYRHKNELNREDNVVMGLSLLSCFGVAIAPISAKPAL